MKFTIYRGAPPKPKAKAAPAKLVGKTVFFKTSADGQPIAGVVLKEIGSNVEIALGIPNSAGLLVISKSTAVIPKDDIIITDALTRNTDVKSWQSNSPIEGAKFVAVKDSSERIIDYTGVEFEGYGSTFVGTTPEDRDGDYIMPKAFDNTLREFRNNPVMLTDHIRSVGNLMGHYEQIMVNERGLAMKGVVTNSPHPDAAHVRFLIVEKSLKTLSIGGLFYYADDYRGVEEIRLYETSLVVVPANPDATFQVRGLDLEIAEKAFKFHAKAHGGEVRLKMAA